MKRVKGFTLVETLVAIAVLMIAVVGPYYIVQQSIDAAFASRDQLIAASLAQDGVEYIYYVRNANYFAGRSWLNGLDGCRTDMGSTACTLDTFQGQISRCDSSCSPLKLNSNNIYQYRSGSTTKFTRTASITYDPAYPNQAKVSVVVRWTSINNNYVITVNETLYNWL
jgi:Tfp pilus assembly protein PilV